MTEASRRWRPCWIIISRQVPRFAAFTLDSRRSDSELIAFLQSLTDPTFTAEFDGERTHPVSR